MPTNISTRGTPYKYTNSADSYWREIDTLEAEAVAATRCPKARTVSFPAVCGRTPAPGSLYCDNHIIGSDEAALRRRLAEVR